MRLRGLAMILLASGPACHADAGAPPTSANDAASAGPLALDRQWMIAFVRTFAADEMAGRYTLDEPAIERAAAMIAASYRQLSIAAVGDAYRWPFRFAFGTELAPAHHVWIDSGGQGVEVAEDASLTLALGTDSAVMGELVDVGFGLAPGPAATKRGRAAVEGRVAVVREGRADDPSDHSGESLTRKLEALGAAGARSVLVIGVEPLAEPLVRARQQAAEAVGMPVVELRPDALAAGPLAHLFASVPASGRPQRVDARASLAPRRIEAVHAANNVLAWIPGAEHPEQIVIVGAHYDHIGTSETGRMCRASPTGDEICNGADDNGSGTAMVLAIARAYATSGRKPARSLVFAHFAGEELGLHGSKAMADQLPDSEPFTRGRVVAMLNFDMVGRLGKDGLAIGGVGSSSGWMPLLDRVGNHALPVTYEATTLSRSDQASFYAHDIPVLFFFTGLHRDYHGPGDESDALATDSMGQIGELALAVVAEVADGANLPFAAGHGDDGGLVTRMPGSDDRSVIKRVDATGAPVRE